MSLNTTILRQVGPNQKICSGTRPLPLPRVVGRPVKGMTFIHRQIWIGVRVPGQSLLMCDRSIPQRHLMYTDLPECSLHRRRSNQTMTKPETFQERLDRRMVDVDSLVCVGLDPQIKRLPAHLGQDRAAVTTFLTDVVAATAPFTACYKPNLAFYTALGLDGLQILADVCSAIPADIPILLDCKVGDVGDTARAYASSWFEVLGVDACTVNPYLGEDTLAPFFEYEGKGVIVICKTSNSGSGDFQDRLLDTGAMLFQTVADRAAQWDAIYPTSVGLVVGATYPTQLGDVRSRVGDQVILLPGFGAQGGDIEGALRAGLDSNGRGLLCSASRSIMYASNGEDFAEAAGAEAARLRDEINVFRATLQQATTVG